MKAIRLTSLIITLIILMLLSVSCGNGAGGSTNGGGNSSDGTNGTGGSETPDAEADGIIREDSEIFILVGEGMDREIANGIYSSVAALTEKLPEFISDASEKHTQEIILGNSERELSKSAYRKLDRLRGEESKVGYVIYTDGSSIAVAFDEDSDNIPMNEACDKLLSLIAAGGVEAKKKGAVASEFYDVIEYLQEREDIKTAVKWTDLELTAGTEMTEAFKSLYSLYKKSLVLWFADLYDPDIGGFYYSNSARNTMGFLPDVDSTWAALGFITATGMADFADKPNPEGGVDEGSYADVIPESMQKQIVAWIKGSSEPQRLLLSSSMGQGADRRISEPPRP